MSEGELGEYAVERRLSVFVLGFALIMGTCIRVVFPLLSSFPLSDGGLFYLMANELRDNGYLLPAFTSYNGAAIPFAYPPLSFYLLNGISSVSGIPTLDLIRVLPAVFASLSIPAFYLLARSVLRSSWLGALSCLAFAFMPATFAYLIRGGGITRAPAFVFTILAVYFASEWLKGRKPMRLGLASICLSAAVLTHLTSIMYAILAVTLLWLFCSSTGDRAKSAVALLGMFAATAVISAPWWLGVVVQHGFDPFSNALQGRGEFTTGRLLQLFTLHISGEGLNTVFAALGMLGVLWNVVQRAWLLPLLLILTLVVYPRGEQFGALALAMLAAQTLCLFLSAVVRKAERQVRLEERKSGLVIVVGVWLLLTAGLGAWAANAPYYTGDFSLGPDDQTALEWVRTNTDVHARFSILFGTDIEADTVSEWFYPLTGRVSVSAPQGSEWIANYDLKARSHIELQRCGQAKANCLERWFDQTGQWAEYLYLRKVPSAMGSTCCRLLLESLQDEGYPLLYDGPGATIFKADR